MAKRISTSDISQGITEARKQAEGLRDAYDAILADIRESANILKKNKDGLNLGDAKDIEDLNKVLKISNEQVKNRQKADQEALKIKKQLTNATDEEVKGRLRFQKAQRDQKNLLQAEITLQEKQIKTLKGLREQNKALKVVRDSLDFDDDADEIERLNDQIEENTEKLQNNSDSFAAAKFDVGKYREEVGKAIQDNLDLTKNFSLLDFAMGIVIKRFTKATEEQQDNEEQTKETTKAAEAQTKTLKRLGKVVGVIAAVAATVGFLLKEFKSSREGAKLFEKTVARAFAAIKASASFAIDFIKIKFTEWSASISNAGLKLSLLVEETKDFFNTTSEGTDKINSLTKEIEKNNKAAEESSKALQELYGRDIIENLNDVDQTVSALIDNQFALADATKKANIEIAKQASIEERLLSIADNDTKGFNERQANRSKLLDILNSENSSAAKAQRLAKQQLDLNRQAVVLELKKKGISEARINQLLSESSLTKALIADQSTLARLDVNVLDEIAESEVNFIEKSKERSQQLLDVNETLSKLLFDEVEQRVDFLIDGNDQIKTSNEVLINDETKNLALRRALLVETQSIISEANKNVQAEIARTVDGLSGADIAQAFDEAISPEDLNERLKDLGLAEIPINRLLELFREIQTQTRDFAATSKVITQAEKDAIELRKDIEAQTVALSGSELSNQEDFNKKIKQLEQDRFDNKVDLLEKEIALSDQGSLSKLKKEKELNDLLIGEEKRRIDEEQALKEKEKKKEEENNKFIRETAIKSTTAVLNNALDASQKKQDLLNEEISEAQSRESELIALSASTNSQVSQLAADSLASQREIEREKTQELEKEKRKQIALETVLAGLQAYGANAGQPNAAGKTIVDVGVLLAGLSSLSSFDVGTDRIDANGKGVDGKGGNLAITHPNEMILQEDLVEKMGFPSRYDVADVFTRYKDGDLIDKEGAVMPVVISQKTDNSDLVREMKATRKEIKNINSGDKSAVFDAVEGAIKYKQRNGNRENKYIKYV